MTAALQERATAPAAGRPDVLLAVDGNSLLHRAFHAYERSGMTGPDSRPIFAVYGFLALLLGVVDRVGPAGIVVGFDDRAGSLRRERYADYKAGRPERSADLYAQMEETAEMLVELGVTVVTPAGLEADDVLASAAAAAERDGWRCAIATSDKDAFGLITEQTIVFRLLSGLDNAVWMTAAALADKYGVTPGQWRDYTALVGDPSDNLPGVLGIGPKTAVKLLAACSTLDNALADPAAVVAAVKTAFAGKLTAAGAREVIDRNRDLQAAVTDIPVSPQRCRLNADPGSVREVLRRRGLPSLVDRAIVALCPMPTPAAPAPAPAPAAGLGGPRGKRPPRTGPRPALSVVRDPAPAAVLELPAAPRLAELGADQAEADRTCPRCGHVVPAMLRTVDGNRPVLLDAERGLFGWLAVPAGAGWAIRPVDDHENGLPYWSRYSEHQCTQTGKRCATPGHEDRPARLYPGGWRCDTCNGQATPGNR